MGSYECEYAEQCRGHPNGEGCVLKHHRLWVETCQEWQEFHKMDIQLEMAKCADLPQTD